MQCLKTVNAFVEPGISLPALKSLVGENIKSIQSLANDDLPPSISEVLAQYDDFKSKIEGFVELEGSSHQAIGYLVKFKKGGEVIFRS